MRNSCGGLSKRNFDSKFHDDRSDDSSFLVGDTDTQSRRLISILSFRKEGKCAKTDDKF